MSTIERDAVSGITLAAASAPAALQADKPTAFYLQSQVHSSDWVLARNADGKVRLAHKNGSIGQLWMREDDPRGGFFVVNVGSGEVLCRTRLQGGEVVLKAKSLADSAMLWKIDPFGGGTWLGLTTFDDWEQKLNLAGNGPYNENSSVIVWEYSRGAPNERWQIVPDTGLITVESITYDMPRAQVSHLDPALCEATVIDNLAGAIAIETSVELARSVSVSRQFTYTHQTSDTLKIATKLGSKLSVDKIAEVSGEISVERTKGTTITFGQQTTESTLVSDKLTVRVTVPPRTRYEYMVRVSYGRVSVPYTATLSRVLPNGTTERSEVKGIYTNVNSTRYDIVAVDVSGGAPRTVQTLAPPAGSPLPRP